MGAAIKNLVLPQGVTYKKTITIKTRPAGSMDAPTPKDLTGCTLKGEIRRQATDDAPQAVMSFIVLDQALYPGKVTWLISSAQTAGMNPEHKYNYDFFLINADSTVQRLVKGEITVEQSYTRVVA